MGPLVFGQMEIGQISGVVTDPSGARVAKAALSLESVLTGRPSQAVSDNQGQFQIDNVPYGTYVLRIFAKGFTDSSKQILVRSNLPVQVSIRLSVAATGSEITVHPDL